MPLLTLLYVFYLLGHNPTDAELKSMIAEVDSSRSGKIDFPQFLTLMRKQIKNDDAEEEVREAFKVFDREGTGLINAVHLKHAMTTIGEKLTEEEVNDMLKEADTRNDGHINYDELIQLLTRK